VTATTLLQEESPIKVARLALFDAYQKYLPRQRVSDPVVIVAIDSPGLRRSVERLRARGVPVPWRT